MVGYRIQYKGCFHNKGEIENKKCGLQTPVPIMLSI